MIPVYVMKKVCAIILIMVCCLMLTLKRVVISLIISVKPGVNGCFGPFTDILDQAGLLRFKLNPNPRPITATLRYHWNFIEFRNFDTFCCYCVISIIWI